METEMENKNCEPQEKSKKLNDRKIELALFLILGFLLGAMLKTEASKKITMGFNDYLVTAVENEIDINQIQQNMAEEQKIKQQEQEAQQQAQQESQQQIESPQGNGEANNDNKSDTSVCEGDSCQ